MPPPLSRQPRRQPAPPERSRLLRRWVPPRGPRPSRSRVGQEPAYLMPLATGAAGLLLLLGLTLQAMALQERVQVSAQERLRREEDLLASAAHQLLAALNSTHRCLLHLPLARWESDGATCASAQALAALRRSAVWATPVRLLAWRPGMDGLSAELELLLEAETGRAARRGRFGARLAGVPPQAVDLRPRDLGGPLP
jgi:hypothetical protein